MENNYRACEIELKKNVDILDGTFSKFGLEVMNVGVAYADMVGGKGIRFYCEIMSNEDLPTDQNFNIKVNVYDKNGDLISMGSEILDPKKFTGYDTILVAVFHETIHEEAAKVRIYLTR